MKKNNIAIIGGGFTGIVAAYRLSEQGYNVTLYEKGDELGGLASGFEIQGQSLEKTYHHLFKSDKEIIELAKELGLEKKLLWLKSSMCIYYDKNLYKYGTPASLLKFKPLNFISRIRHGLVLYYLIKENNWEKLKYISAYDWLLKWSGKRNMEVVFEPLLKGKFNNYYDKVSMAWMWARVHIRGNSQEKGGEKLGYFEGGFRIIIDELEKRLKINNVNIVLNANIEKIESSNDSVSIFLNSKTINFDKIISTAPAHIFANLISHNPGMEEYIKQLNSIDYIGAVVAVFSSSQKLSEYYWHNINDLSMPFLAFINHTNLVHKSYYNGKYIYYIGTYIPHSHKYFKMSSEEILKEWFVSLKKIFSNFDEKMIDSKNIFKFKYAQHIVDLEYDKKIPQYETPLKNIYLFNFSQIYPEDRGTNYAVREGNKVLDIINS